MISREGFSRFARVLLTVLFVPLLLAARGEEGNKWIVPFVPQLASENIAFLRIAGHEGQARVVRVDGYNYVDLTALVQIMNGSVSVQHHTALLQLPKSSSPESPNDARSEAPASAYSHSFMASAIETIAAMREWSTTLVMAARNGLPIGNSMIPYRGRAMDQLRLTQAAATTEAEREAFNLLNAEFGKVDAWSNRLVTARNSMSGADLALSEDAVERDPEIQSIIRCGHFLGSMIASGTFTNDGSCQ